MLQKYAESLRDRAPAWLMLAAAAVWTAFPLLLYGLWREPHSYRSEMLPGALLLTLILLALGWAHPALYFVAAVPLAALNTIYAHTAHFWHIGDLPVRVETALDSSPEESREFIQRFVLHAKFTWLLGAYLLGVLVLGAAYWYLFRGQKAPPRKRRGRALSLALALILLAGSWPFLQTYPGTALGITAYKVYHRVNPILQRKDRIAALMAQAPPLPCTATYDKIVFVLGESANRDYMSAYGFSMPTTPFMEHLPHKVLLRAISPVNQTMTAVPIILTPATVADYQPFYTSPSIVSDLRRCGYQTVWLSNQLRYSPYTSSVSSIASEANTVRFTLDVLHLRGSAPDGVLFQLFSPNDLIPGKKQAYFFHLIGSHFEWKERYPPDQALIPHPKNVLEEYINTIHYTDIVLQRLFETFRSHSENMLFVYVSDHGEWMTTTRGGHAHADPFQEEYRVPLLFWSTHPEDLQVFADVAAQDRLVNTENLDRQMRYLMGLESDPHFSYSTRVLALGPGQEYDYLQLPAAGTPETR